MTAAFAADDTDLLNGFIEYRSDSWAIVADPVAITTFNFFNVCSWDHGEIARAEELRSPL